MCCLLSLDDGHCFLQDGKKLELVPYRENSINFSIIQETIEEKKELIDLDINKKVTKVK